MEPIPLTDTVSDPHSAVNYSFADGIALGSTAPAASIHHYYGARSSKDERTFAQYTDMAKRFNAKASVESLGRHTGGHCPFCGDAVFVKNAVGEWEDILAYEWDHLIPASKLGLTVDGNICPICSSCNNAKSDKDAVVYYNERRAAGLPVFYASAKDLKRFLKSFSKPYRKKYGKSLYGAALNNSRNGATELELRQQLGTLHTAVDKQGDFVLSMAVKSNDRLNTSSAAFIEEVKSDVFAKYAWAGTTERAYGRIFHKVQYAMDDMVAEGELATPDMSTIDFDGFYKLAKRVYGVAFSLSMPASRISEAKKILSIVASYSPDALVRAAGDHLATYADYRDNGSVILPIPLRAKAPRASR